MEPQFIHLRVHSAYSLLEGAMKIPALMSRAAAMGFPAMAVTDTANMFGAKAFSDYAPKNGIKPILGTQMYIRNSDADDVLKSKGGRWSRTRSCCWSKMPKVTPMLPN